LHFLAAVSGKDVRIEVRLADRVVMQIARESVEDADYASNDRRPISAG
jgi:hypothetical protein